MHLGSLGMHSPFTKTFFSRQLRTIGSGGMLIKTPQVQAEWARLATLERHEKIRVPMSTSPQSLCSVSKGQTLSKCGPYVDSILLAYSHHHSGCTDGKIKAWSPEWFLMVDIRIPGLNYHTSCASHGRTGTPEGISSISFVVGIKWIKPHTFFSLKYGILNFWPSPCAFCFLPWLSSPQFPNRFKYFSDPEQTSNKQLRWTTAHWPAWRQELWMPPAWPQNTTVVSLTVREPSRNTSKVCQARPTFSSSPLTKQCLSLTKMLSHTLPLTIHQGGCHNPHLTHKELFPWLKSGGGMQSV